MTVDEKLKIEEKVNAIVTRIYGGDGVTFSAKAKKAIKQLEELGLDKKPVCIAKTPASLTDDAKVLGCPKDFTITIRDIKINIFYAVCNSYINCFCCLN